MNTLTGDSDYGRFNGSSLWWELLLAGNVRDMQVFGRKLLAANVDFGGKTLWRKNTSYVHFSHFRAKTFPSKCFSS